MQGKRLYKLEDYSHQFDENSLPEKKSTTNKKQNLGSIYTPQDFAQMITSWAITRKDEKILDVGVGEGVISLASYNRLLECGASSEEAQNLIYGAEIDPEAYKNFQTLCKNQKIQFPNIYFRDFFECTYPKIDVVIGNPPYVRRSKIQKFENILTSFSQLNIVNKDSILGLTDLYVYFILRACKLLKDGGKLAVITSDSWLTSKYGRILKDYLKNNFEVENLTSLDRNIFNADVRALITFATKKYRPRKNKLSYFVRVKNGLPAKDILKAIQSPDNKFKDVKVRKTKISSLAAEETWGIQFKFPEFYEQIESHKKTIKVRDVADTQIGIQTLAKEFFIIPASDVSSGKIESEFLEPLIKSVKQAGDLIIEKQNLPDWYLLSCDLPSEKLKGKQILKYIEAGENESVAIRGKDERVVGYHNKERIQRSKRSPWYNLKSEILKRGRAEILVPRIISHYFHPIWNKAEYVPGEFFIEFRPKNNEINKEVYLAILSSTLFEVCLRIKSPLYGGGAYSIYPGQFKDIPIINPERLTNDEMASLTAAYYEYTNNPSNKRKSIDILVAQIMGWSSDTIANLNEIFADLIDAVNTFKKRI